ncbi:transmembrane and coiled-coil domain-containing protein 4-like isoform X1 [Phoenix dactylifera]|uniref:Transmembrane and coiled-coil domain-containing protein 4-like isoform X1 n=1 Tax=Phoenix dactylifera TaxID=42345 RepID=A0A8B7CDI1_PHODC|nr:transmembrane and coiled-coil domain-containing protein 4-like isoform X1 [Phoenix dactylifera]
MPIGHGRSGRGLRSSSMMAISTLSPTQKYAAGALLALALRQAQIQQTQPLDDDDDPDAGTRDRCSSASASSSTSSSEGGGDDSSLWTHESRGLLRPVFRFLDIDPKAWPGLEETAASSIIKHHVGAYLRIIFEEDDENSSERFEKELALAKAVDAMVMSLEAALTSAEESKEKDHKHGHDSHKRSNSGTSYCKNFGATIEPFDTSETKNSKASFIAEDSLIQFENVHDDKEMLEDNSVKYQRKVAVLYELLSACVADTPQDNKKTSRFRKGYDARHRVALRFLATWLDVKWIKMVAMEIMVACSAMAAAKAEEQSQGSGSEKSKWARWKRGGIIGAAALTGGALLAVTGGLAAPAIAAGFSALAPTLGTLVPVIGASGFAAIASAAGSVAGSVAVAASFGAAGAGLSGSKMARRIGSVEEFEFKPIGDNHNQGRLAVGILVSGFAFEKEDFIKPWEGLEDNLERYVLQWESKYIIAVSTAIQDWITSRVTTELMKQGAMMTVLSTLVSALAWPAVLLAATDFIDSKWTMAIDRSDKAGKLLAEVLLKGLQGNRPVTLIGFSLGARVIFKCLRQLAESGDNEGLVERVVLLGAPVSLKGEQWETARKMVAGRFVNVYSTNDWILGVTFRASLLTQGLAGIQAVDVPGIENVDVTDFIDGHSSYLSGVQQIVEQLELDTYYPVFSCIPIISR